MRTIAGETGKRDAPSGRQAAVRIVARWLRSSVFPSRLMETVESDRAFVLEVVSGVVRWRRALEWVRQRLVPTRPRAEMDAPILVGLYQVLFMDTVPDYAIVNETVETAKSLLGQRAANFVNAVLRRALAEGPSLQQELAQQPAGVRLSHPDLLLERWTRQFGEENARRLCEWNNTRPDIAVRVNLARTTFETFCRALETGGIHARPHAFAPGRCLVLPHGVRIADLPGYSDGWFAVQDPSTMAAVELLEARPGERVLDACAAPGGKTGLLAELMQGQGALVAMDPAAQRLAPLRENLARLGWGFVTVIQGAVNDPVAVRKACAESGQEAHFQAILLDVPCTNTGVVRRRPDARWRFSLERLGQACETQRVILDGASALLGAGGRMVYSTCSLEPEENEEQVRRWLAAHPGFTLAGERRLFPPDSGTDGMYGARLVKQE
ncbi:MAG: 16S rRNA (cytosine(967)-C(5))-methyltransferase RsmB [Verrucomicrobiota bacterium]